MIDRRTKAAVAADSGIPLCGTAFQFHFIPFCPGLSSRFVSNWFGSGIRGRCAANGGETQSRRALGVRGQTVSGVVSKGVLESVKLKVLPFPTSLCTHN